MQRHLPTHVGFENVAHLDAVIGQVGDGGIEVIDPQGEVLTVVLGDRLGLDEVDLAVAGCDPRARN